MITYTAKSSVVTVSGTPTLLVSANKDRTCLKLRASGTGVVFGGSDVSGSNGYQDVDGGGHVISLNFEGDAAIGAVYGMGAGIVSILEVVPDGI